MRFAFGQTLRRAGKRREAAVQLREALHFFTGVNAGAYIERSRRELQASGSNPPHRNILDLANLSSQEQAVAALVAEGLRPRRGGPGTAHYRPYTDSQG